MKNTPSIKIFFKHLLTVADVEGQSAEVEGENIINLCQNIISLCQNCQNSSNSTIDDRMYANNCGFLKKSYRCLFCISY